MNVIMKHILRKNKKQEIGERNDQMLKPLSFTEKWGTMIIVFIFIFIFLIIANLTYPYSDGRKVKDIIHDKFIRSKVAK